MIRLLLSRLVQIAVVTAILSLCAFLLIGLMPATRSRWPSPATPA